MKTACFFTYRGLGRISIARTAPRNTPAGFRVYRALTPGIWFKEVDWPTYTSLYDEQLSQLDPRKVWADLHQIAGGAEPVLLCWERLDEGKMCHRHLVADWFQNTLGESVSELPAAPRS